MPSFNSKTCELSYIPLSSPITTISLVIMLTSTPQLCYTRGSVIPLSLLLSSRDSQALDLFSKREAIDVRLRRHISHRHHVVRADVNCSIPILTKVNSQPHEDSAMGVWWVSAEGCPEDEDGWIKRRMNGEIHLPKSLKPTCEIAHFSISVSPLISIHASVSKTDS